MRDRNPKKIKKNKPRQGKDCASSTPLISNSDGVYFCHRCGKEIKRISSQLYFVKNGVKKYKKHLYCSAECYKPKPKDGKTIQQKDANGKLRNYIHIKDHPCGPLVIHARWVMEQKMGRYLKSTDYVHHINEDPLDDRIENLRVFESNAQHQAVHRCPESLLREDRDAVLRMVHKILGTENSLYLPNESFEGKPLYGEPMEGYY